MNNQQEKHICIMCRTSFYSEPGKGDLFCSEECFEMQL